MLRGDELVGVVRHDPSRGRPFGDSRSRCFETFADQAVIAIENVRLFQELQERKQAHLTESLEQQTATAEILRVISSSPTDLQPVLDAVAENAARVCGSTDGVASGRGDGRPRLPSAVLAPMPLAIGESSDRSPLGRGAPWSSGGQSTSPESCGRGRVPGAGRRAPATVFGPPWPRRCCARARRSGVIISSGAEVRPFTDKQIELLETFADQAVIAIENVRLFNETKEALEQQTATAEILRVISELADRHAAGVRRDRASAVRLCDAHAAGLPFDGEPYDPAAARRPPDGSASQGRASPRSHRRPRTERWFWRAGRSSPGRSSRPEFGAGLREPSSCAARGWSDGVGVPAACAATTVLGAIGVGRAEVRPFTQRRSSCSRPSPTRR